MNTIPQIVTPVDKANESFRAKVIRKCGESVEMKQKFFAKYAEPLETMSRALAERFQRGGRLFVMGNGGSLCERRFTYRITTRIRIKIPNGRWIDTSQ